MGASIYHIEFTNHQLNELIKPFVENAVVLSHQTLSSGLANTNICLNLEGHKGPYLVRFYTRDSSALEREVALYELLKHKIPVPKILYKGSSSFGPYALMAWIEGSLLSDVLVKETPTFLREVAKDVGRILGLISSYSYRTAGFFDNDLKVKDGGLPDALEYIKENLLFGHAGKHLGSDFANELWQFVLKHKHLYNREQDGICLCHGDFSPDNLIVHFHEPKIIGVLDWEFSFAGSYLFDIAQFLRGGHPHYIEESFISAYEVESRRTFSANWRHIAKMLDLVNFCGLLDHPEPRPRMVHDLKNLIVDTMTLKL